MTKVFISYRRADSGGSAGRLYDHLEEVLGVDSVFRDVDAIELGTDFEDEIEAAMAQCDVLLAVIGPRFLDETNGPRLHDPEDHLRRELAAGLMSARTRVVPVLVDGATPPSADALPAALGGLAKRQAMEVRDGRFTSDVDIMLARLGLVAPDPRQWVIAGSVAAAVLAVVAVVLLWPDSPRPSIGAETTITTTSLTTTTEPTGQVRAGAPVVRALFPESEPPSTFDADTFVGPQPVATKVRFTVVVDEPEDVTYEWFSSRDGSIGDQRDFEATLTGACFGRTHDITVLVTDEAGRITSAKTEVVVRSAMLDDTAICPVVPIPNLDLEALGARELAVAIQRDDPQLWEQLTATQLVTSVRSGLGEDSLALLTSVYEANPTLAEAQVRLIDASLLTDFEIGGIVNETGG